MDHFSGNHQLDRWVSKKWGCVIKWSLNLWNAEKIDSGHKFRFRWQQHWNDFQNEILVRGERILKSSEQLFHHEILHISNLKTISNFLHKNCPGPTHILFLTNPFNFICSYNSSLYQFLKHVSRSLMSSEKHTTCSWFLCEFCAIFEIDSKIAPEHTLKI